MDCRGSSGSLLYRNIKPHPIMSPIPFPVIPSAANHGVTGKVKAVVGDAGGSFPETSSGFPVKVSDSHTFDIDTDGPIIEGIGIFKNQNGEDFSLFPVLIRGAAYLPQIGLVMRLPDNREFEHSGTAKEIHVFRRSGFHRMRSSSGGSEQPGEQTHTFPQGRTWKSGELFLRLLRSPGVESLSKKAAGHRADRNILLDRKALYLLPKRLLHPDKNRIVVPPVFLPLFHARQFTTIEKR